MTIDSLNMHISIHSIRQTLFEGQAQKLICRTPQGQITILDHHLPMVSLLTGPFVEAVNPAGEATRIPMTGGFLEVQPESRIVILAES